MQAERCTDSANVAQANSWLSYIPFIPQANYSTHPTMCC